MSLWVKFGITNGLIIYSWLWHGVSKLISQINFESVASYRGKTSLNTDKKVNIIYGLNGSGKSTFSNYFYKPSDENTTNVRILMMAQKFLFIIRIL